MIKDRYLSDIFEQILKKYQNLGNDRYIQYNISLSQNNYPQAQNNHFEIKKYYEGQYMLHTK